MFRLLWDVLFWFTGFLPYWLCTISYSLHLCCFVHLQENCKYQGILVIYLFCGKSCFYFISVFWISFFTHALVMCWGCAASCLSRECMERTGSFFRWVYCSSTSYPKRYCSQYLTANDCCQHTDISWLNIGSGWMFYLRIKSIVDAKA